MSMLKLVVSLDEEMHKRLRVHCAMEGITAADVVRKLIEDYLQKVEKKVQIERATDCLRQTVTLTRQGRCP